MLKIGVKLQIIPPNAQQRSAPLLMTHSENLPLSQTPLSTIAYSSNQYENTSIKLSLNLSTICRPVGRAVMHLFVEREVRGSNLGRVKSETVLAMARRRCNVSSKETVLPRHNDVEMGLANMLHCFSVLRQEYY